VKDFQDAAILEDSRDIARFGIAIELHKMADPITTAELSHA
jgi:hypothetical protein